MPSGSNTWGYSKNKLQCQCCFVRVSGFFIIEALFREFRSNQSHLPDWSVAPVVYGSCGAPSKQRESRTMCPRNASALTRLRAGTQSVLARLRRFGGRLWERLLALREALATFGSARNSASSLHLQPSGVGPVHDQGSDDVWSQLSLTCPASEAATSPQPSAGNSSAHARPRGSASVSVNATPATEGHISSPLRDLASWLLGLPKRLWPVKRRSILGYGLRFSVGQRLSFRPILAALESRDMPGGFDRRNHCIRFDAGRGFGARRAT